MLSGRLSAWLPLCFATLASTLAPPALGQTPILQVASLPNGLYTICSDPPVQEVEDDLPRTVLINTCYFFRKSGNQVIGVYGHVDNLTFYCVAGTVRGSLVQGSAMSKGIMAPFYDYNRVVPSPVEVEISPRLEVANLSVSRLGQVSFSAYPIPYNLSRVLYRTAYLDLTDFYLIQDTFPGSLPPATIQNSRFLNRLLSPTIARGGGCDDMALTEFYNPDDDGEPEFFPGGQEQ